MLGQYSSGTVLRADVFGHCRVGDHTEFKIGVRWGEHADGQERGQGCEAAGQDERRGEEDRLERGSQNRLD